MFQLPIFKQRTWKSPCAMSVAVETTVSRVPLPLPTHFAHAERSFSLKKRRLPFSSSSTSNSSYSSPARLSHYLPPLPPSKGCPSVNMFPQHQSPWTPLSCSLSKSPPPSSVYDPSIQQTYFSQCFTNLGLLGRGSFGEVYKVSRTTFFIYVYLKLCITYLPFVVFLLKTSLILEGFLTWEPLMKIKISVEASFSWLRLSFGDYEREDRTMAFSVFFRSKTMWMAASMQWSALLIASGAKARGTGVWGKLETTSACLRTLTSCILWQPGRSVADCTSRQSCVAPACCSMLKTSLLARVCLFSSSSDFV